MINVKVPAGIEDGKSIRLKGQGASSPTGGPRGDVLLKIRVNSHSSFRRRGNDLIVQVPISINEAIDGGKVDVPTPSGTITLTVPPKTSSGKKLRVKGHGVPSARGNKGDLYAELHIVLPEDDADLEKLKDAGTDSGNPRSGLRW